MQKNDLNRVRVNGVSIFILIAIFVLITINRQEEMICMIKCGGRVSGFRRIPSETIVRQNMGRTFWWLATVKILQQCDGVQGKIEWI
jgi:hypothetical protein